MKKINIFVLIGAIAVIIGTGLMLSEKPEQQIFQEEIYQEDIKKETVSLIIDDGTGNPETFEFEFSEGMTAFDILKNKTEESSIILKAETYDIGIFIEAIGDKENGQNEKYWMYYVNEEMPMVSADQNEIKPGDKVEFRFEISPF